MLHNVRSNGSNNHVAKRQFLRFVESAKSGESAKLWNSTLVVKPFSFFFFFFFFNKLRRRQLCSVSKTSTLKQLSYLTMSKMISATQIFDLPSDFVYRYVKKNIVISYTHFDNIILSSSNALRNKTRYKQDHAGRVTNIISSKEAIKYCRSYRMTYYQNDMDIFMRLTHSSTFSGASYLTFYDSKRSNR